MLLSGYSLEIFKSKCQADSRGVHCFAHLNDDVSEVLPYLNTLFGGFIYTVDPPSLMVKNYGKLITIHARKIAINALQDAEEAERIVAWLQREINETWERRGEIEPSIRSAEQPVLLEVLKLLPRTNCRECGQPTCMVFASRVIEGSMDQQGCPPLSPENQDRLRSYLSRFRFE